MQARGEVVLCAGVFGSPKILRQSFSAVGAAGGGGGVTHTGFFDHTVLPFMALGNWWSLARGLHPPPSAPSCCLPPNSVHGWVYLDGCGIQLPYGSAALPRYATCH